MTGVEGRSGESVFVPNKTVVHARILVLEKGMTTMSTQNPSLGESYEPFGRDLENPYPFYTRLRREEPVTFSPVLNAYLVSHFEDVRAIF